MFVWNLLLLDYRTVLVQRFPRLLTDPRARKVVENLVLLSCAEARYRVSNKGRDFVEKRLAPLHQFDRLPPTVVVRVLKHLISAKPAGK
jgi:hypothetical protein